MFEKIARNIEKKILENVKKNICKEIHKSIDDILPIAIGITYTTLLIFSSIPQQRFATQQVIINNYFILADL